MTNLAVASVVLAQGPATNLRPSFTGKSVVRQSVFRLQAFLTYLLAYPQV